MNEKIIKEANPLLTGVAVLIIQITDFCNFSCKYCITGKKFSGKSIDINSFSKIEVLIIKLKEIYENVDITITGGEPTLGKDFFDFLKRLLDLDVKVKINTNAFILHDKQDQIFKLSQHKNVYDLYFNVTFHYAEYNNKSDLFVNSLKKLEKYNLNYGVNFLLPDNVLLEDFLYIKNKILGLVYLKTYNYNLIKGTNGKFSESYSSDMLNYYYNSVNEEEKEKNIEIIYEDGSNEILSSSELVYKGLNNFSGYKCSYFSKKYVNIWIGTDLNCYFGSCYSLNRLKYSIDEVTELFNNLEEKNIICGDHSCLCDSDFYTKKIKIYKKSLIKEKLEMILLKIKPTEFDLSNIVIGVNSIQIILSKEDTFVFVLIEKIVDKSIKYPFSDGNLGYQYFSRNKDNEFIELQKDSQTLVKLFLGRVYGYNLVFKKILN